MLNLDDLLDDIEIDDNLHTEIEVKFKNTKF